MQSPEAGKLIWEFRWNAGGTGTYGGTVTQDRLGTNRASGARFYPYGDEITSTGNDETKFATYNRDSYTTLDYADQRFYASTYGRFNTPDRYGASAKLKDPTSWNRYAYVLNDPVNGYDPTGLIKYVGPPGDESDSDAPDTDPFYDGSNSGTPVDTEWNLFYWQYQNLRWRRYEAA